LKEYSKCAGASESAGFLVVCVLVATEPRAIKTQTRRRTLLMDTYPETIDTYR
jgi:hypothetical protein